MLQKILKRITNNFGLKVLAAVIAIVMWLVIVNTEDPEKTVKIAATVDIINSEYLEEQGQTYEILNNSDQIVFNVTGQRSIVESLKASDFTVTADLSDIENNSQIPIHVSANRDATYIEINNRAKYVEVFVEDIVTAKIPVEVEATGTVAEGFQLSDIQANIKEVTVKGPESIVNSIARAVALVKVESLQADTASNVSLIYYDAEDNTVDTSRLTMNHTTVSVSVGIVEQKTVPIEYVYNGTPDAGYRVVSATGSLTSLEIMGKPEQIAQIKSILVSGPEMNVSGADQTVTKSIDILDYLPEGIALVGEQDSVVEVTILLEAETIKSLEMPASNVTFTNVPEGYQIEAKQNTVTVSVKGYPTDLNELVAANLKGTADASRVREGEQALTVTIEGGYRIEGTVQITVQATKQTENPPVEDSADGSQTQ